MKILLLILSLTTLAHAGELKINRFVMLENNSNNSSAEVCLSIKPAPADPVLVQLTVDPRTRQQAYYNAWVDPRGSVCHIVSTFRGRIEAQALGQTVSKSFPTN